MKTNITFLSFLLFSIVSFSQTETQRQTIIAGTNVKALSKLQLEYKVKFTAQKNEAIAKANEKGWPLVKIEKNDGISELIRIDKAGNPVYFTTDNAGAAVTTRANKLNSGGSLGLNLDGQNMTIALWDGGKVRNTHNLLTGKAVQNDEATTLSGHATHVAGTMMGNATASASAKGMASQANLLAHDWNNDSGEVAAAAGNGLLISNHSYGNSPASVPVSAWGQYDSDASEFDQIMFDAPYYQFVNSAGNSRNNGYNEGKNGYDLLSGKSTSKNGIIVAAVSQVTNYTGPSSVPMSSFSSWGPTDDGRIKPDISGKGVNVRSSTSSSNTSYSSFSGTSMSSPNVAGTLLLLQQHHSNLKGNYMKAATLRGLALHTADEAGTTLGPDYRFGWGLLNAEKAALMITNDNINSRIREKTLLQGDVYIFNASALQVAALNASICWTDPTGPILNSSVIDNKNPVLVNDLDIRITKDDETNFPWKLNPAQVTAAATKGDNIVDNIEKIEISNPSNTYTVTISHKNQLQNGLQNYSLLLSNVLTNKLLLSTNRGLSNRICEGVSSSTFNFEMETLSTFSGSAQFSVTGLPAGANGTFQNNSLSNASLNSLMLTNLQAVSVGTYNIVVTAIAGTESSNLFFKLIVQNGIITTPTLSFPSDNAAQIVTNPILTWDNLGNNVSNYTIEIAKDINFSDSLQSFTSTSNQFQVSDLDFGSSYFWRVKANNLCGEASFSSANTFITACSNNIEILINEVAFDQVTVTWDNPNVTDIFEVQIVPQGQPITANFIQVIGNNYTFTGLNSNTDYDIYVRSSCSGNLFSDAVLKEVTTKVNHCVDGYFTDSGNANGNYSDGEYIETVMYSVNPNEKVSVTFTSFNLEDGADNLKIYNGPSTSSPIIGEQYGFTGTNSPGTVTSTHPSGRLTFLFYSDGVNTAQGWNATVACTVNLSTIKSTIKGFSFSPNPASSTVTFAGNESFEKITVTNVFGQVLQTIEPKSNNAVIDISNYPIGTLFVKVATKTTIETVKILKK